SHSGLALVGLCINRYCDLAKATKRTIGDDRNVITHPDILRSYLGLLCLGKSDYEAITSMRDDDFFAQSLGVSQVPSCESLRQRLDQKADNYLQVARQCSLELLKKGEVHLSPLDTGHIPLDADVFPMDNSGTKKENVSRTYKGHDGYAPIAAYIGMEGWCLDIEFRPGSQHSQEGFIPFMKEVLCRARTLTSKKLLVRLDSGHDSIETRVLLRKAEKVSYIVKWNPRRENTEALCRKAFEKGTVSMPRKYKKVALLTIKKHQEYEGKKFVFTKVVRVTERRADKHGQMLMEPDIKVEGWWTNLDLPEAEIIRLYQNHGLSEQFHSEFKTDLDLERLPSGKFATNAAVMALGALAYNILRMIGQLGLLGKSSPIRHPGKRRRLKTVIQELIYLAARLLLTARRLRLRFGRHCPAYVAFAIVYNRLLVDR
ncbi:IS1380 family transposase, partial [Desulfogranum mediterraneum]|uniref:IS1380 family transposase n=1 Tax=Desulfogranum mediterraneum TaxID=160661 RepID=UPI00048AB16E